MGGLRTFASDFCASQRGHRGAKSSLFTTDRPKVSVLLERGKLGAAAEGWNSCSPSNLYALIPSCPSGDTSHCTKLLANACFDTGCLAGLSRITS